jgi:L-threonylcarbamoyladenylate synthase
MGDIPVPALEILLAGGIVAYPTSTLPGLATLPTSEALDRLFTLKQRQANQPVSLGVASLEQAQALVDVPEFAYRLLEGFGRGTLTLLLDAHVPLDARLGGNRVAVRVFAHPTAIALASAVGPVTATSANVAGVAPLDDSQAAGDLLGLPDSAILPGACPGGMGSTLVSIEKSSQNPSGFSVSIMREGVIPTNDVDAWMLKNH